MKNQKYLHTKKKNNNNTYLLPWTRGFPFSFLLSVYVFRDYIIDLRKRSQKFKSQEITGVMIRY